MPCPSGTTVQPDLAVPGEPAGKLLDVVSGSGGQGSSITPNAVLDTRIPQTMALMALAALGLPKDPFREPFHARDPTWSRGKDIGIMSNLRRLITRA